jgi:hypothetical protein
MGARSGGRVWGCARLRAKRLNRSDYRICDTSNVGQHVTIPESQYGEALGLQPIVTVRVFAAVCVLAPVRFDDQAMPEADKINDIAVIDDELPPPFKMFKPVVTEQVPKLALGVGWVRAHVPCALDEQFASSLSFSQSLVRRRRGATPHPALRATLSRRGRGVVRCC